MNKNMLLGILTETPLHPGTGQNLGVIDLPVQRERHSRYPMIPASSFKGSLRSNLELDEGDERTLFGAELGSTDHFAGALAFSDTKILAFPVRSMSQYYVWVTSPLVIDRLKRDLDIIGVEAKLPGMAEIGPDIALVSTGRNASEKVILEDIVLNTKSEKIVDILARKLSIFIPSRPSHSIIKSKFEKDLVVIGEENFRHLLEFSTEVVARNQLDAKKQSQNLWYMEILPRDTLFYSVVMAEQARSGNTKTAAEVMQIFGNSISDRYIQLGGNETIGHGLCSITNYGTEDLTAIFAEEE